MIKKSAIVDKSTVDAQDARVKKMVKIETWFSEGSLEPFEELEEDMMILCMSFDGILDWLELASNRQLLFNNSTVGSIARGWYPIQ